MIVVSGPPGSGKSDLAEHLAVSSPFKSRYYIATMKIMDDAGRARAERHRKNRAGKGFITLEIETDIETADTGMEAPFESVVLLECVANLTGNMMHDIPELAGLCREGAKGEDVFARRVVEKITCLEEHVGSLIVVTSIYDIWENDDEDTRLYKILLKKVNIILERVADKFIVSPMDRANGGNKC